MKTALLFAVFGLPLYGNHPAARKNACNDHLLLSFAATASIYCNRGDLCMNPCALTASVTAVANALACERTTNELNVLGAVFSQLGDTLTTIAAQRSVCESVCQKSNPESET